MRKRMIVRVLWLLIFSILPMAGYSQSAHAVYQEGVNKMKSKSYKEAITYFRTAKSIGRGNDQLIRDCDSKISECNRMLRPTTSKPKQDHHYSYKIDTLEYENQLNAFKDSVLLTKNGGLQLKIIPIRGSWEYSCFPDEAREWLSVNRDEEARVPTLTVYGRRNYTTKARTAVVRVRGKDHKGRPFNESFRVLQEKADIQDPTPEHLDVILSLQFKKKGGKQVVKFPRDTQVDIPENVSWCVKSEFKNKEGQNKLSQIGINVSNFLVNLLGGEPKTVFCNTNEFVIETTPNKSGSVRSTNIIIPGKGIINVSQDK